MALTKKHFEQFAAIIAAVSADDADCKNSNDLYLSRWAGGASARTRTIAEAFATMAQNDNKAFNRRKFMEACGME
jgi:hypothetical protein